ncbi:MAG TPA: ribosome small subunit-dependent GTPase A, partial [Streptosporangiaceae bacterium]|nr:ribosome small subunit-dependent GTPase A [Streptosporangiaceae bacterium]
WRHSLARCGAGDTVLDALEAAASTRSDPVLPGRIIRAENPPVTVLTPDGTVRAGLGAVPRPVAGDWVLVGAADPAALVVTEVLPRRTALVRHASGNRTQPQTLAANMDDVFVTVAADRNVSLAKVERFLALVWESGATPVLVLTKSDLLAPGAAGPLLATAAGIAPGAEVCLVSAVTGDGIDALHVRIGAGRTAALIGSSGAGKSSLLNALAGAEVAVTSQVRGADGKGRHTTAWRELVVLDGGAIIDTPGLRGLGLWLDQGGLDAAFADVAELALSCRFSDCAHDTEPGCAVIAAIEAGTLEARRLASYRKLGREAAYVARKHDPRAARAQSRQWAALARQSMGQVRPRSR